MRQLAWPEILQRGGEIRALASSIAGHVKICPPPDEMMNLLHRNILHAWEHEGVLVLAQVHTQRGIAISHVCYAAGRLEGVLGWYTAWEAECRRCHVDFIRVEGRKGWQRIGKRFGFVPDGMGGIVKRLH